MEPLALSEAKMKLSELVEEAQSTDLEVVVSKLGMPDDVGALVIGFHPQLKGKIRAGFRHIVAEPECGKSLKDDFDAKKGGLRKNIYCSSFAVF